MFMHPNISHEIARARQHDLLEQASRQRLAARLRGQPRTTRHHGRRAFASVLAAAVALVLVVVLAGCGGGHCGTGTGGHGGTASDTANGGTASDTAIGSQGGKSGGGAVLTGTSTLAGEWVGPVPGDEGECGIGSGEWIFDPDNGTYQFDAIYDSGECGYQSNGTYQVQGDTIYFQPLDEAGFQEIYGFEDGDLVLCDVPDTAVCYDYQLLTA